MVSLAPSRGGGNTRRIYFLLFLLMVVCGHYWWYFLFRPTTSVLIESGTKQYRLSNSNSVEDSSSTPSRPLAERIPSSTDISEIVTAATAVTKPKTATNQVTPEEVMASPDKANSFSRRSSPSASSTGDNAITNTPIEEPGLTTPPAPQGKNPGKGKKGKKKTAVQSGPLYVDIYQIPVVPKEGLGNFLPPASDPLRDDRQMFEVDPALPRVLTSNLTHCRSLLERTLIEEQHSNSSTTTTTTNSSTITSNSSISSTLRGKGELLKCTPLSLPDGEEVLKIPVLEGDGNVSWKTPLATGGAEKNGLREDTSSSLSTFRNSSLLKTINNASASSSCLNWNCPIRSQCMSNAEGHCYQNREVLNAAPSHPIFKVDNQEYLEKECGFRQPIGGDVNVELSCAWAPEPDQPPPIPKRVSTKNISEHAERTLQAFKNFTANSFQKWYDWGNSEEIIPMTKKERKKFLVSGRHIPSKQMVYMLHNICIRPTGALAGYRGPPPPSTNETNTSSINGTESDHKIINVGPYEGGDDVKSRVLLQKKKKELFISEPTADFFSNIERLESPPKFYMNRRIAFMPLTSRSDNPGHALQRLGGLLANIEFAFGPDPALTNSNQTDTTQQKCSSTKNITLEGKVPLVMSDRARSDVTTVYAFIDNERGLQAYENFCSPKCTFQSFAFTQYTTLVTDSHFTIWNNPTQAATHLPWANPSNFGNDGEDRESVFTPNNTMLCFKDAVVYQSCHKRDCSVLSKGQDIQRHSFGLYHYRSPAIQEHLARRLRRCAGMSGEIANRPRANSENPVVLYAYRDRSRGFSMDPFQVQEMSRVVREKMNGRLVLSDMSRLTTWEMVRLYSQADVLIGPYGAGLYFMFVMPPKAVTIEINTRVFSQSKKSGIDQNRGSDYGGMAVAADGFHVVAACEETEGRYPSGLISISPEAVKSLLVRADCILQHLDSNRTEIQGICGSPNPKDELRLFQREQTADFSGIDMRRTVRALHSPAFQIPRPSIVYTMYSLSQYLSRIFITSRHLGNRPILVAIGDCGPKDYQFFYHFWMNYQSQSPRIFWVVGTHPEGTSVNGTTIAVERQDDKVEAEKEEGVFSNGVARPEQHSLDDDERKVGGEESNQNSRAGVSNNYENQTKEEDEKEEEKGVLEAEKVVGAVGSPEDNFNRAQKEKRISSALRIPPFRTELDILHNIKHGARRRRKKFKACRPDLKHCLSEEFLTIIVTKKYLRSVGLASYLKKRAGGFAKSPFLQALHSNASEPLSQEKLTYLHLSGKLNYDLAALIKELPFEKQQLDSQLLVFEDE